MKSSSPSNTKYMKEPYMAEKIEMLIQETYNVTIPAIVFEYLSNNDSHFEINDLNMFYTSFGEVVDFIIKGKLSIVLYKTFFSANACREFLINQNNFKDNMKNNFSVRWFDYEKDINNLSNDMKKLFKDIHNRNMYKLKNCILYDKQKYNNFSLNNNINNNISYNINNINNNKNVNINSIHYIDNDINNKTSNYVNTNQNSEINFILTNIINQNNQINQPISISNINNTSNDIQNLNLINPLSNVNDLSNNIMIPDQLNIPPLLNIQNFLNQQNKIENEINVNNVQYNDNLINTDIRDTNFEKYICKYLILLPNDKDFQVAHRLIGNKGYNMKKIICECQDSNSINIKDNVKLRLRGRGSGYKEGPENKESDEPLHLCISSKNKDVMNKACILVDDLLNSIYEDYKNFCIKNNIVPIVNQLAIRIDSGKPKHKFK